MVRDDSKVQEIVRDIAMKIADKSYPSHTNLPSLRNLSKQYGASQTTISRALDVLASMSMIITSKKQLGVVSDMNDWKFNALSFVFEQVSDDGNKLQALVKLGIQFSKSTFLAIIPLIKKDKVNKTELQRAQDMAWSHRDELPRFLQDIQAMIKSLLVHNSLHAFLWIFNDLFTVFTKIANQMPIIVSAIVDNWDLDKQMLNFIADGKTDEAVQAAELFFEALEKSIFLNIQSASVIAK